MVCGATATEFICGDGPSVRVFSNALKAVMPRAGKGRRMRAWLRLVPEPRPSQGAVIADCEASYPGTTFELLLSPFGSSDSSASL